MLGNSIRSRKWVFLVASLCLFTGGDPGGADSHGWVAAAAAAERGRGGGISLDRAVSKVQRKNPGRVLSAETLKRSGRAVHRIKILTRDGRVRSVYVDADTGKASN